MLEPDVSSKAISLTPSPQAKMMGRNSLLSGQKMPKDPIHKGQKRRQVDRFNLKYKCLECKEIILSIRTATLSVFNVLVQNVVFTAPTTVFLKLHFRALSSLYTSKNPKSF